MTKIRLKKEPRTDARLEAYGYQEEALEAVRDLEYAAIFHEQGLGKSKIAIDLMRYWLDGRVVDTVLFVVKKGLVANWEREFRMHTFMRPRVLTQDRRANYQVFNSPARLMLCHFEVLKGERERFALFLQTRDVAVILDESTKIKNPAAALTQAFFELAPGFKRRVIMTGTPVANRPYDIWAQVWFLDQGRSLGNQFAEFKAETDLSNRLLVDKGRRETFERVVGDIHDRISSFSVRETKDSGVITLPEKTIQTVRTDWEPNQYEMYEQVRTEMAAVVMREGIPEEDNAEAILKRLLRLVQITSNPRLIDQGYRVRPGKLDPLVDLVTSIVHGREKCIIWSAFVDNVEWLSLELGRFGVCKVHGGMEMRLRNQSVERFLDDHEARVFIATPGAAKEGLTLTVANHVIFYDRTFSLDDYLQAQDRIHRISQEKRCYVPLSSN